MESYSPNLLAVVGFTKMLAEVFLLLQIFHDIFAPSKSKGASFPALESLGKPFQALSRYFAKENGSWFFFKTKSLGAHALFSLRLPLLARSYHSVNRFKTTVIKDFRFE